VAGNAGNVSGFDTRRSTNQWRCHPDDPDGAFPSGEEGTPYHGCFL